jgi:hypothetical protein
MFAAENGLEGILLTPAYLAVIGFFFFVSTVFIHRQIHSYLARLIALCSN